MNNIKNCLNNLNSKKDFQELMLAILNPLKPHYSEHCACLTLGCTMAHYDIGATWMEAFSRPLWALVPFYAGGGRNKDFEEIYRKGLIAGTDENSPEYWGECTAFDQRFVEMAAIAYGIMFAPDFYWNPLSEKEKENLAKYLGKINEHPLPVCNWILFAVLVNISMKYVNMPYDEKLLERYLNDLETFYLGNGWYQDGDSGQKDYYISFAIHFYCLVYAKNIDDRIAMVNSSESSGKCSGGKTDQNGQKSAECPEQAEIERAKLYKNRAMEFSKQFIYWFDEDGDAIPFGRSLTYRFAQMSFFSACLMVGLEPFPVEVMKGLIVRHLKSWLSRPVFDRDEILTIGYGYPNLTMGERYNAPGSPYWAMKTFAFLMLPDEHPFWKAEAAPYPELNPGCPMPEADMFVYHYGKHATAFAPGVYSPNGHGQIVAKYGKFAYDTKFSISIAKSCYNLNENAPDNMLAFEINDYIYVRRICIESKILDDGVYSKWSPYPGIIVETTIIPSKSGHKRVHKIESDVECFAYDFGFAVNRGDFEDIKYECSAGSGFAEAKNNYSVCRVSGNSSLEGEVVNADPNTNLLYTKTAIPGVKYHIQKGTQILETEVKAEVY